MRRWLRFAGHTAVRLESGCAALPEPRPWRLDLLDRYRLYDIYATHTRVDTRRAFAD
jgi:hypothetical protein